MRKRALAGLMGEIDAHSLWRESFGPRTAAWLVRQHRRQLRRSGAVDFIVDASDWDAESGPGKELFWLSLAFETLERRRGWSVMKTTEGRRLRWRVTWWGSRDVQDVHVRGRVIH